MLVDTHNASKPDAPDLQMNGHTRNRHCGASVHANTKRYASSPCQHKEIRTLYRLPRSEACAARCSHAACEWLAYTFKHIAIRSEVYDREKEKRHRERERERERKRTYLIEYHLIEGPLLNRIPQSFKQFGTCLQRLYLDTTTQLHGSCARN